MKTDPYRCTLFPLFCNNENILVKNRQASRKWHFRHFKNGNIKMSTLKIGRRESHTYQNKTRCPLQEVIFDDSTIFMQVQRIFFNQSFAKLNRPFIKRLVSKKIAELSQLSITNSRLFFTASSVEIQIGNSLEKQKGARAGL